MKAVNGKEALVYVKGKPVWISSSALPSVKEEEMNFDWGKGVSFSLLIEEPPKIEKHPVFEIGPRLNSFDVNVFLGLLFLLLLLVICLLVAFL